MGSMNAIIKFFQDGGFFLYPLVIIFVVGVAIAVERWIYLTVETSRNRSLWDDVAPHLGAGNFKQAITLANNSQAQIGTVLKYGLARLSTARPAHRGRNSCRRTKCEPVLAAKPDPRVACPRRPRGSYRSRR